VDGVERVVGLDRLAEVAAEADALVVTLPGAPATDGATVVNVGRGTVIDEDALVDALRSGPVGCAVLDVTAVEPLPADSPLWDLPNVVISPHTAALSVEEDRRIAELTAENARRLLDGEPLLNVVDPRDA
jgi:phosphoglycerate dehydrogenase-like enzyme